MIQTVSSISVWKVSNVSISSFCFLVSSYPYLKHSFTILSKYLQRPAGHWLYMSKSKVIIFTSTFFCPSSYIPTLRNGAVVHWVNQKENKSLLTLLYPISLNCHQLLTLSSFQQLQLSVPMKVPNRPLLLAFFLPPTTSIPIYAVKITRSWNRFSTISLLHSWWIQVFTVTFKAQQTLTLSHHICPSIFLLIPATCSHPCSKPQPRLPSLLCCFCTSVQTT